MANFSDVQTAITAFIAQAEVNKTVEGGATVVINGIQAANLKAVTEGVAAALAVDNASDDSILAAVASAINGVTQSLTDSATPLAAALVANTGPLGPPTPVDPNSPAFRR